MIKILIILKWKEIVDAYVFLSDSQESSDKKEWLEIKERINEMTNEENPNYTIENFEKWLNADKKRKRGLWLWSQVIEKVKSDPDLFNSLATGQDLGGWNLSDPKFRKQYQFEDYYQVFLEWRKEMDAQNGEFNETDTEKPNEEENKFMVGVEQVIQELQEKKLVACEKINQLKNIELGLEYSELRDEEKNKLAEFVLENIKKNKEGWSIKEMITLDHYGRDDYQTKKLLIIHSSAQLKYNPDGILIYDRKKMWEKSFFSQEQQKELENILPIQKSFQEQNETKLKKYGEYALYGGLILVILLGIWWIIRKIK